MPIDNPYPAQHDDPDPLLSGIAPRSLQLQLQPPPSLDLIHGFHRGGSVFGRAREGRGGWEYGGRWVSTCGREEKVGEMGSGMLGWRDCRVEEENVIAADRVCFDNPELEIYAMLSLASRRLL